MDRSQELLDRAKIASYTALTGILAWSGIGIATVEGGSNEPTAGTPMAAHEILCKSEGESLTADLDPYKDVSISTEIKTGSTTLRFLETLDGQLYVDFGGRENIEIKEQDLAKDSTGLRAAAYQIRNKHYVLMTLFAEVEPGGGIQSSVQAECLTKKEYQKSLPIKNTAIPTRIVAEVPR